MHAIKRSLFFLNMLLNACFLSACISHPTKKTPHNLQQGDYAAAENTLSDIIQSALKSNDITGLSIALVDDSGIRWQGFFGKENSTLKQSVNPSTLFEIFYKDKATNPRGLCKTLTVLDPFLIYKYLKGCFFLFQNA